jgi:hypothetical protein
MRENRTSGTVRLAPGDLSSYRERRKKETLIEFENILLFSGQGQEENITEMIIGRLNNNSDSYFLKGRFTYDNNCN